MLSLVTVLTVVEAVVLPLSLYLGPGTWEFAETSCVLDLDVGGVYLLDPLLRDLLRSLLLYVEVSARGVSTDFSSVTRLAGLVLNRTLSGLDERVGIRDVILTLDLLNGVVAVVVASDEPILRLVKPNGRGCDTTAIVDLLANVVVVVVVGWLELLLAAGNVVNRISVAESSTSFTVSVVEPMSALGLTLDGFSGGATLITVMTSVEVEVGVADVVDNETVVLAVVLGVSEYSSSLVGEVVSLVTFDKGAKLDKSSEVFEVVLLNLCTLVYLKN